MFSKEAEAALLGAVLIDPKVLRKLNVSSGDFYLNRHQFIFDAMQSLSSSGHDIDMLSVSEELDKRGKLNEIGGPAYLMELLSSTPSSYHAETYAKSVCEWSRRRKIIIVAGYLAQSAYDMGTSLDEAIAKAMTDITSSAAMQIGAKHIREFTSELYDQIEKACANPNDIYGIQTGIKDWDYITNGQQLGEVTIISGKPGLGKSLLSFELCAGMAKTAPGAIYGMEMAGIAMVRRYASGQTNIPTKVMRSGRMTPDNWTSFTQAVEKISSLPIWISDSSELTTTALRADLARLKESEKIQWFMVDYLDLFSDLPDHTDLERGKHISKQIHSIARDLKLSCLAIQSMNKGGMSDGEKGMDALSGSGKYSYDADNMVFMSLKEDKPTGAIIRLTWKKNREGDLMSMDLLKRPGFPAFGEIAKGY